MSEPDVDESLDLPAWSEAFHGDGPGPRPDLGLDHPISADWAYGDRSGRGVRVAVVDSGIDASHPLVGGVADYVAVVSDPGSDDGVRLEAGEHIDLYGHGTACAAVIRSLAPQAELVSVRVLGASLKGSAAAFARGLEWCLENDVTIANLSLSTTNEPMGGDLSSTRRRRLVPSHDAGVVDEQRAQTHHPERVRRRVLGRLWTGQ